MTKDLAWILNKIDFKDHIKKDYFDELPCKSCLTALFDAAWLFSIKPTNLILSKSDSLIESAVAVNSLPNSFASLGSPGQY